MQLRGPQPPRLPDPSAQYSVRYIDELLKILRIYFNQLGNAIGGLLGPLGKTYLQTAYAEYSSAQDQTIASTTTAYVVTFDTTVFENGVSLVSSSQITVERPGIYQMSLTLQLANSDTALQTAGVWFRVNGVDVPNSRARFSLTESHGGQPGHMAAEIVYLFDLDEQDYVEAVWYATDTGVTLEHLPANTSPDRPAAPSAIASVVFLSARATL
jgi:hypothetical protein